jgi:hypothetical protein
VLGDDLHFADQGDAAQDLIRPIGADDNLWALVDLFITRRHIDLSVSVFAFSPQPGLVDFFPEGCRERSVALDPFAVDKRAVARR